MTNGEVITAMFPNMVESAWENKKYLTDVCGDYSAIEYTDEWWNTEYKGSFAVPKKGEWIRFKNFESGYFHIKCSNCGQYWSIDDHAKIFKYCFNCGADMRGGKE